MSETPWTPGPWTLHEYSETGGYDCMTAGVRAGNAYLDGATYGQKTLEADMKPEAKARMMADARLIAAAPELAEALEPFAALSKAREQMGCSPMAGDMYRIYTPTGVVTLTGEHIEAARAALAKARGEAAQ